MWRTRACCGGQPRVMDRGRTKTSGWCGTKEIGQLAPGVPPITGDGNPGTAGHISQTRWNVKGSDGMVSTAWPRMCVSLYLPALGPNVDFYAQLMVQSLPATVWTVFSAYPVIEADVTPLQIQKGRQRIASRGRKVLNTTNAANDMITTPPRTQKGPLCRGYRGKGRGVGVGGECPGYLERNSVLYGLSPFPSLYHTLTHYSLQEMGGD